MVVGSRFAGFLLSKTDELADLNRRNNLDIKEVTEIYLLDEIRDDEICLGLMDEGHTVDGIYLDFAKAFDHGFLSAKMMSFGLGVSSRGGLKHTFLDGSQEYTSVGNPREPFQCAVVFRRPPQ